MTNATTSASHGSPITPPSLSATRNDSSSEPEEEVRDENDHSWRQGWGISSSRTAQDHPEGPKGATAGLNKAAELSKQQNIQTDPWTAGDRSERSKGQLVKTLPPLGGVSRTSSSSLSSSPNPAKMMDAAPPLPPSTSMAPTMVTEARKPLATRSDAVPADNMLEVHSLGSGRVLKDDTIAMAAPADAPPCRAGTNPTDSNARGATGPAAAAATTQNNSLTTTENNTTIEPSQQAADLATMRPPIDKQARSASPSFFPRNPKDTATTSSTSPKRRQQPPRQTAPPRDRTGSVGSHRSGSQRSAPPQLPPSPPQLPPSTAQSRQEQQQDNVNWKWNYLSDPDAQEQALFEQRLCEDAFGVAVRKINQNGKSNLRYIKCIYVDPDECEGRSSSRSVRSSKSVSSLVRSLSRRSTGRDPSVDRSEPRSVLSDFDSHRNLKDDTNNSNRKRALAWGKKKDVKFCLDRFVCVRTGKTTDRTRRNASPAARLLSLITDNMGHAALDIEAPTRLDRDKFARAFARFLGVPVEAEDGSKCLVPEVGNYASRSLISDGKERRHRSGIPKGSPSRKHVSSALSAPDMDVPKSIIDEKGVKTPPRTKSNPVVLSAASKSVGERLDLQVDADKAPSEGKPDTATSLMMMATQSAAIIASSNDQSEPQQHRPSLPNSANASLNKSALTSQQAASSSRKAGTEEKDIPDDGTVVSSLTGAGFDQEIVEELHNALTDLRAELEASRAEAARAVKVAEQAIQSAEKSSAGDWNSTVTHKAAEAAAVAQKRSAEAIAKQRLAEERLEGEKRSAAFWRRQAEAAEEEAGILQTRAAAAEVQRAAMAEELESDRAKAATHVTSLKQRFASSEVHQREALEAAMERNRALEIELDGTRRDLISKHDEAKSFQDALSDLNSSIDVNRHNPGKSGSLVRKKLSLRRKNSHKKPDPVRSLSSTSLLEKNGRSSSSAPVPPVSDIKPSVSMEAVNAESVLKLHAEACAVRQQFELLRRVTADELRALPATSREWAGQASEALTASQSEIARLREKLAMESATRRKLLHEVQDLRGSVRVYCRPRPYVPPNKANSGGNISIPSHETIMLHPSKDGSESLRPMSFEFDRVFDPDLKQNGLYAEVEELVLSVLDGYKVCIMTYGQTGCGKTRTMLGDVLVTTGSDLKEDAVVEIHNYGIHLQAAQQLFSVAEHRNARYQDVFSLTIVEVQNERLCDLIAGTDIGETRGQIIIEETKSGDSRKGSRNRSRNNTDDDGSSNPGTSTGSKVTKLEIRTNQDGDTVVQGLISVPVSSFDDVRQIWEECLANRAARLAEQGVDRAKHEASSHVIATLNVVSTNIATGICTVGKIQFADLAGADLVSRKSSGSKKSKPPDTSEGLLAGVGNNNEWKFVNKSLSTLTDVVNSRCQFHRAVPYRNSTVTHLLRDSLEADTKVLMVVCVSSDPKDLQETACALRFASRMKRVNIGKATKHTLSHA